MTDKENEEAIQIDEIFKAYLKERLKDKQDLLFKISNINPIGVIKKQSHSLKINVYESVLLANFEEFVKIRQEIQLTNTFL